jgi:hypothetical protein
MNSGPLVAAPGPRLASTENLAHRARNPSANFVRNSSTQLNRYKNYCEGKIPRSAKGDDGSIRVMIAVAGMTNGRTSVRPLVNIKIAML